MRFDQTCSRSEFDSEQMAAMRRAFVISVIAIALGAQSACAIGDVTKLQIGVKV